MDAQKSGLIVSISGYVGVAYTYGTTFGTCKGALMKRSGGTFIDAEVAQWDNYGEQS
jgi:hypothetical protein